MQNENKISSFLSNLERRLCSYWSSSKQELPSYNNNEPVKCKDFDVDRINFTILKVKVKERKIGVVSPITSEPVTAEYCNMV
jgi:hypothetical protein